MERQKGICSSRQRREKDAILPRITKRMEWYTPRTLSEVDFCRIEEARARTPKVVRKNSRISSSQIVYEFDANPIDCETVKMTASQPQSEFGRGDESFPGIQRTVDKSLGYFPQRLQAPTAPELACQPDGRRMTGQLS